MTFIRAFNEILHAIGFLALMVWIVLGFPF